MVKEDVKTVVNKIEEIDSKISSLTQEKGKITSEYYLELLEYDLGVISEVEYTLKGLKTERAKEIIEEETNIYEDLAEAVNSINYEIKDIKGAAKNG